VNFDDAKGVLAIWNDIREGRESEFEFWYNSEHFPERLAVPGFRAGRRYEAVAEGPRSFVFYVTDTPEVLKSKAYIERLNNPTQLTQSVMTDVFINMNRTLCQRTKHFGTLSGTYCVTARFEDPIDVEANLPKLDALSRLAGIARCELWSAVDQGSDAAAEEQLRGGDEKIAACVAVETLRLSDAERAKAELEREFSGVAAIGAYRLLCQLGSRKSV
jgi:hypothetical protein